MFLDTLVVISSLKWNEMTWAPEVYEMLPSVSTEIGGKEIVFVETKIM